MTLSNDIKDKLKIIYELVVLEDIDLLDSYIHDDEDLILFSLNYLIDNLDNAFNLKGDLKNESKK